MADTLRVFSVGAIAQRFCVPLHRVLYVIRSRNIRPVGTAGNARVFDEAAVSWIASELRRIDKDRQGGVHAE